MPKALEDALKKEAKKLGLGKERTGAYVYGTLRKTGWTPNRGGDTSHTTHPKRG